MKIAILNDTHCGSKGGSLLHCDYKEKFYNHFIDYLLENSIDSIIHLGDFFEDRKKIDVLSFNREKKFFLDKLKEHNIHMHILVGNHDIPYKNTLKYNALETYLGEYENIVVIDKIDYFKEMDILLVPWICNDNRGEIDHFISKISKKNKKETTVLGHFEFTGFDYSSGVTATTGDDPKVYKDFKMVLSGHYHSKSSKDNIHYLGSQFEFTWIDCDETKYFHVFDTTTNNLEKVDNPYKYFQKIYVENKDDLVYDGQSKEVKVFISSLADKKIESKINTFITSLPSNVKIRVEDLRARTEDDLEDYVEVDISDSMDVMLGYVREHVTTDDRVIKKFIDLYSEVSV